MTQEQKARAVPGHGTISRHKHHKCDCGPCRVAWLAYGSRVRRLKAYGQWQPYVDAGPAREHVQSLRDANIGLRRIAVLSGVGYATLYRLMQVDEKYRIRASTEAALLKVEASLDAYADAAAVEGTGTRRRIEALAAMGWSIPVQADRLGVHRSTVSRILDGHSAEAATVRAVRALFDRLWDQTPPATTKGQRISLGRTRAMAARRGWLPALAWDDNIDDPAARPYRPLAGHRRSVVDPVAVERALKGEELPLNPAEVKEVVRLGTERGMSAREIAKVAGRDTRTVQRRRANA